MKIICHHSHCYLLSILLLLKVYLLYLVLHQKIHDIPKNLIKKTGNEVFDIPDGHLCCGSAGTYNLLQTDIAKKLLQEKVSNIKKVNPEFIVTGNIGCITQISNGTKIPILHTIEIMDWYTGGIKPKILGNL